MPLYNPPTASAGSPAGVPKVFANAAARAAASPDAVGQIGFQFDTQQYWFADALTAGAWGMPMDIGGGLRTESLLARDNITMLGFLTELRWLSEDLSSLVRVKPVAESNADITIPLGTGTLAFA